MLELKEYRQYEPVVVRQEPVILCQVCLREIPQEAAVNSPCDDCQWHFCGPQCHALWEQGLLED